MADPPPLCHSTPAKDIDSKKSTNTGEQNLETDAPEFFNTFGSKEEFFAFAVGATAPRDKHGAADTESLSSKPVESLASKPAESVVASVMSASPRKRQVSSKGAQSIATTAEAGSRKANIPPEDMPADFVQGFVESLNISQKPDELEDMPADFVKEFQESVKLSQKLSDNLQRLAGRWNSGSFKTNADKQTSATVPKAEQPTHPADSEGFVAFDIDSKPPWQDRSPLRRNGQDTGMTEASRFGMDPDAVSVPSDPSAVMDRTFAKNNSTFFIQSESSASRPHASIVSKGNITSHKAAEDKSAKVTISGRDPFELSETHISTTAPVKQEPAATVEQLLAALAEDPQPTKQEDPAAAREKLRKDKIEAWVSKVPASKPGQKHVHAFDTDEPIIDVPPTSPPKPVPLRLSPPINKHLTQRRHSDSFCSSGPIRQASAATVGAKPYVPSKDPKPRPRTPTKRMKYAKGQSGKPQPSGNEAPDLTNKENTKEPTDQDEPSVTADDEVDLYVPGQQKSLLLEEELRKEPYFSRLVPFKDLEDPSEKNRRFSRILLEEQYGKLWIGAYDNVKGRVTGVYNPITGKREFDKRKGEKEIYDPSSERVGTVDWKAHQVFECYFAMRETLKELKKLTGRQEFVEREIPRLEKLLAKGECDTFAGVDEMATMIRSQKLEMYTILPGRLIKLRTRQTLLKRAGENNLWDIAKQDYKFHYSGEMLYGILFMRDYFAGIEEGLSEEDLVKAKVQIEIPHYGDKF
ncbi:hypothetical protein TWF481_001720 [Arthrobotrys musiformis]|uniref:Uncharacterized protein n=1 Tax=Arthrobotrys musiformis TaxID=47236 RepID=A0AAV9VWY2_9PEZI